MKQRVGHIYLQRNFFAAALLVGLVLSVFMQGSRGILETTEGRYAESARETVSGGNILEPMLNGQHHWTKPPLTYWAIGLGSKIFGNNPWGARAYLIVAFMLTIVAVHALDGALWKQRSNGIAALIFATSPIALAASNTIATDALLTLWEAWALAFYWLAARTGKRHFTTLMWLMIALAVATKGPVGLLPLTAILPAQFLLRRQGESPRGVVTPEGLLLFALVGLSWFAYVIYRYPAVLKGWIGIEIIGRLQYDAHHRASSEFHKVFTSYLPIMLLGTGPWLAWLCWKTRPQFRRERARALFSGHPFRAEHCFLLLAIGVQFFLFAASTSRMPLYLVPLFVPLCVVLGRGFTSLLNSEAVSRRVIIRVALCTAAVMLVVKGASAYQGTWKNMTNIARQLRELPEIQDGTPLVALFRAPLNGLEYHLARRIPTLYFSIDDPDLLRQDRAEGAALPSVVGVVNTDLLPVDSDQTPYVPADSRVLVRSKDLDEFGQYFETFGLNVVTKSDHWTLLRVDKPLSLNKIAVPEPVNDES